jgi:hypothetical protein
MIMNNTSVLIIGAGPTGAEQETIDDINRSFDGEVKAFLIKKPQIMKSLGNMKSLIVIRPDGYIGMMAGSGDQIAVKDYLEKFLSPRELN